MKNEWRQDDIDYLIEHYPNTSNKELSEKLGITLGRLRNKTRNLNLKKSKEHIENYNKSRRLTMDGEIDYDYIKNIALKYTNRSEFINNDGKYYRLAKKNGILDDICSHMLVKSYSTPQLILKQITERLFKEECLYNNRTLIKPYELDLYFENLGLAFEYDGARWHLEDDVNKTELCKQHGVELITIVETSRDYENDVKQQLINNLRLINKTTKKRIKKSDIKNFVVDREKLLPSIDYIREICQSYDDYKKFKLEQKYIHRLLIDRKLIVEFTSHMKINRVRYDLLDIEDIINKYDTYFDLAKNEPNLVQYLRRRNKQYLYEHLPKNRSFWSNEEIVAEIGKYEYLGDFRKDNNNCYSAAINKGLYKELSVLKKKRNTYTIDELKEIISKYNRFKDFTDNEPAIYSYCTRHDLHHLFEHLPKRRWWSLEELEELVGQYKTLKEFASEQQNAYTVIRRRYKHLIDKLIKYSH